MRALAGVVVLAACGRLEFGAVGDAPMDRSQPASDADLSNLLVGCQLRLAMDEASWTQGLVDQCGGENPGTAVNGAVPVDDPERGRVGELVGGTSCVLVADAPQLRGGAALTVSAWIRPTALAPSSFGIVSKRTDFGVDTAYSLFVWTSANGGGPVNHLYVDIDTEDQRFEDPTDEFLDAWHQVTMVYDGARAPVERISIYIDGAFRTNAPESAASIPAPAVPPAIHVGCLPLGTPAQSLVGRIDDVVIWSRALPAADVGAWYAASR